MPRFRVGQMVRIAAAGDLRTILYPELIGAITTIRSVLGYTDEMPVFHGTRMYRRVRGVWYELDITRDGEYVCAVENLLHPVYDGDQPSTWEEMGRITGWRPGHTVKDPAVRAKRKADLIRAVYGGQAKRTQHR